MKHPNSAILPQPNLHIRNIQKSIIESLNSGSNPVQLTLPDLVQRAYNLVYEESIMDAVMLEDDTPTTKVRGDIEDY